jgi:cell wall-associated NlpC family hydrolase
VIVMSGAMVASLALPASASTPAATRSATRIGLAVAVAAPSAAPAPLAPPAFGNIGFSGVVKPKPIPVLTTTGRASRSATRIPLPKPAPAPAAAPASRASGVVGIAASLAGIYYVYGGESTAGFDCSGYTQYVFAKIGINLPRTAEEQRQAVRSVSDPRPGDLVFFGSPAYHVGIYAGNGMMWDSPSTGSAIALRAIWSSSPSYGRP